MLDKKQTRLSIRKQRKALTVKQVVESSSNVFLSLISIDAFSRANKVALYCSNENEIATDDVLQWCVDQGKSVCLPVMKSKSVLQFYEYDEHQCVLNSHGIKEPSVDTCQMVSLVDCDVIVVPLVAFDRAGGRIGRGGGYYDRALEFISGLDDGPLLVGLAYEFQEVPSCDSKSHDVALDMVVLSTPEVLSF